MENPHVSRIDTCYLQRNKQTILIVGWFHLIDMTKEYFLPGTRSIIGGFILILIGLFPIYFSALLDHSLVAGLLFYASMFTGFPQIILGLILLVFLLSGFRYLFNSRHILRLKLDEHGIYYLPFGEDRPSKYRAVFNLFYVKAKLRFIPYSDISFAENIAGNPWGNMIIIHMKDASTRQLRTAPFTSTDRQEVIDLINSKSHE